MRLENRVALITGGGRGIGRAIALAYAKEGAKLVLTARTLVELEESAQAIRDAGGVATVLQADITSQSEVEGLVRQTLEQHSTVDILVNNAGMAGPIGALQDNDVSAWIRTIQVNLIGTYLCCRSVLPIMLKQNRGKIINLSGSGSTSAPYHLSAYGSSKAAVIRLTEVLSLELAHTNVQVNALGPGSINTRMWEQIRDDAAAVGDTELHEFGIRVTGGGGASIENAAELAVWLASDTSASLSGRLIHAVTDDFPNLASRISDVMASDAYTLRRMDLA